MKRKLTSILSMDVAGFSAAMERDETGTLQRLKSVREQIIEPKVASYSGRTVKLMGDGALIEFSSVTNALTCAVEIQKALSECNAALASDERLDFRAGLHLGDVLVDGSDIYGDGVNVAARLEQIAPPGGVVLSQQVHDQVANTMQVPFRNLGEQSIKGISRPIFAYQIDFLSESNGVEIGSGTIRFGAFEIDPSIFELRKNGTPVQVEPRAFELMLLLARNAGKLVTKDQIFAELWDDRVVSEAALSSQVKAARKALDDSGTEQSVIATVHGRGFRFVAPLGISETSGLGDDTPEPVEPEGAAIPALASRPSVAILPFENMNRDKSEDYLADGITEDITLAVAKNRWLTVVARSPAFSFRDSPESLRKIGQKLQAHYLVTGSVRKAGSRFRIGVEIVDALTEISIWSERFDRDGMDIFDLQDDISEMVAARIEAELG
ncbi:MAG: winged helix-turn-helix domain-containing protein, partial [Pseudomonadota bacterium]